MDDTGTGGEGGGGRPWPDYEILVISMNDRFWLWRGEEHLYAMLSVQEGVPFPIGCVIIPSPFLRDRVLPEDVDLGELWQINPSSMALLRSLDKVVDLHPEL